MEVKRASFWTRNYVSGFLYPKTLTDYLGVGLNTPQYPFHLYRSVGGGSVVAMFEQYNNLGIYFGFKNTVNEWGIGTNSSGDFIIRDTTGGSVDVMQISAGAPLRSVSVRSTGFIGLGKATDYRNKFQIYDSLGNTLFSIRDSNGNIMVGSGFASAKLQLPAGTATAGTAPLKFTTGTLLTTPEKGTIEYDGCSFCITNVATQKAIDRTSDVVVETVTVENTTTETTMWTAPMVANSLCSGNLLKFHADGIIQNGGATAADEVTLRIKVGGTTVATLNPTTRAIPIGSHWHIDANATQRTLGVTGQRAVHIDLEIDGTTEEIIGVATIDTTSDMTVTITAQWASADTDNIISLYQGFMEYKN